jgi:hypothetical protein
MVRFFGVVAVAGKAGDRPTKGLSYLLAAGVVGP